MSDSEFATAVELIVGGFEKKYNYTLVDVTGMEYDYLIDLVKAIDSMIPDDILLEIDRFMRNVSDDASVYLMRTNCELCGIISVQD